jgi:hypothetical protein
LESLYIFNTVGDRIGYLTSQLVQGARLARLAGIEVATNVESMQCDSRFCTANLKSTGLNLANSSKLLSFVKEQIESPMKAVHHAI